MTPGIQASEYVQRRNNLASALPDNSVAVLAAADIKYRSGAVFFRFHQDSNFLYLTGRLLRVSIELMFVSNNALGFNEPAALAVIGR